MPDRPRRLVETVLPLAAINRRSVQEGQGRVSPLHLWWSHKPAAACRAALLASLLADGGDGDALAPGAGGAGRAAVLDLVARAVAAAPADRQTWAEARAAIAAACGGEPPTVFDPFSGSAAIAAEAQRLGLDAVASDLNPVAVLIAKALLEIPPLFGERPAVHPGAPLGGRGRLAGLIADVAHYGRRVRDEAHRRIGSHYPAAPGGTPVIAWLWARTVRCPNPACGRAMPLVHSFNLSRRPGKEAWVVPGPAGFRLGPGAGCPPPPEGTVNRRFARCVYCGEKVPLTALRPHVRGEGFGQALLALVAGAGRGRAYVPANAEHQAAGVAAAPAWVPETELPGAALGFATSGYGLSRHRDLYTPRQLLALTTFADAIRAIRAEVEADGLRAGLPPDGAPLRAGGVGAGAYAEAVAVYLAVALDRAAAKWCTFARWHRTRDNIEHPFASPGLHMLWDFAEANPFSPATGNWLDAVDAVGKALERAPAHHGPVRPVRCLQADAAAPEARRGLLVCTDPPYFDKLPYADMADLFYIWLRPVLRDVFPDLFQTVLTPKAEELVADPHRFGGAAAARAHFLRRMQAAFAVLRDGADPRYPLTVFYAFKEEGGQAGSSGATGWEVMLTSLIAAGLCIVGTWPLRTEHAQRLRTKESNTLAASILLVCRPRAADAPAAARRDWVLELRRELPGALAALAGAGVSPADLAQAAIGPGMALFSRYSAVLDGGQPMAVQSALRVIGEEVDAALHDATGDLDPATRFCLAWCAAHGFAPGPYGDAEVLARAKDVALDALARSGDLVAASGRVRLCGVGEAPAVRARPAESLWGTLHAIMRALDAGGVAAAARALAGTAWSGAQARALATRLFTLLERRGDGAQAQAYDAMAASMEQVAAAAERTCHGVT